MHTTDLLYYIFLLSLTPPFPLHPPRALSTCRRNDRAPLRNTDDRVGIGGWALNHVLAVRKK